MNINRGKEDRILTAALFELSRGPVSLLTWRALEMRLTNYFSDQKSVRRVISILKESGLVASHEIFTGKWDSKDLRNAGKEIWAMDQGQSKETKSKIRVIFLRPSGGSLGDIEGNWEHGQASVDHAAYMEKDPLRLKKLEQITSEDLRRHYEKEYFIKDILSAIKQKDRI